MVHTCVACGFRLGKNSGRSSHRFPLKTESLLRDWVMFVGKPDTDDWKPTVDSRICGEHFCVESFRPSSSKPTLTATAIPSIKGSQIAHRAPLKLLNGKVQILEIIDENSDTPIKSIALSDSHNIQQQLEIQKRTRENQRLHHLTTSLQTSTQLQQTKNLALIQSLILENKKLKSAQQNIQKQKKVEVEVESDRISLAKLKEDGGDILSRIVSRTKDEKRKVYDSEIKIFSATVMSYSKKAYEFVRNTFNQQLPCPRTIKRLLSKLLIKPGFLRCTLNKMKDMSDDSDTKLYCTLIYDEMAIRDQALVNSKGEIVGFVDYGDLEYPHEKKLLATSALFVMAVSLNGNWKLPIGYFLTNGLPANLMQEVISTSLIHVHGTGVRAVAVTFDGLPANLAAVENLGASLTDPYDLVTWFPHPGCSRLKVYVILDPPHMLKLMRNLWNSPSIKGVLLDQNNQQLRWSMIVELHKLQQRVGVRAANGLTKTHIDFKNQKMKVSLAAKIFSQSVSNSLKFCKSLGLDAFQEASPLCSFLDTIDRGFDLLNSRHPSAEGRKAPLRANNKASWEKTIADMKKCIFGLKNKRGTPILQTQLRTGPLGFLISLQSVDCIMHELVCIPYPKLQYLLTYKMCQDHLEIFFSCLRACGGFNDNPNVIQLQGSVRSVLASSISPSLTGNCMPLDDTYLPRITETRKSFVELADIEPIPEEEEEPPVETYEYSFLNEFIQNVTAYIAGNIVKKLLPKIKCTECRLQLVDPLGVCAHPDMKLIDFKQNGGLALPSRPVVMICRNAETTLREITHSGILTTSLEKIEHRTFQVCFPLDLFNRLHTKERFEMDPFTNNHKIILTKMIIKEYSKIRLHHYTKEWSRIQKGISCRQLNKKTTLFQGM